MNTNTLFDTHCHLNMIVKNTFDTALSEQEIISAQEIINQAANWHVRYILNVGTSLVESLNCVQLAHKYQHNFASVGIHPNDLTSSWRADLKEVEQLLKHKEHNKIVAVGECGFDRHYPDHNMQRQHDAFDTQVELALKYDCALVVHTRDAREETVRALEQYKGQLTRGVIHCFSENSEFADFSLSLGFYLGIGGTLTYPKNTLLRTIFSTVPLEKIVLETDAPFLPPQVIRGQKNYPKQIKTIAEFLAATRNESFERICQQTTRNAFDLFGLPHRAKTE